MKFITDRKRAIGMGSAKSGTGHFWAMKVSSVALLILIPLFVFTFGSVVGEDYNTVREYYSHPFPAIIAILTIIVSLEHFQSGAQVLIEDYVHGLSKKISIILVKCLSYGLMATGVFAVAKLAF